MPKREHQDVPPDGDDEAPGKKRTQFADKRTRKKMQTTSSSDDGDAQLEPKKRVTREDKGIPRLEPRDIIVLRWIMQMYAVRFDHLQRLLALHSPKKEELIDPGHVSPSTVRTHLHRWKVLGLVSCKKILANKENPLWCWLTPYGLRFLAFEEDQNGDAISYSYYEPRERELQHIYLINQARMYIEQFYPEYCC